MSDTFDVFDSPVLVPTKDYRINPFFGWGYTYLGYDRLFSPDKESTKLGRRRHVPGPLTRKDMIIIHSVNDCLL